MSSDYLKYEVSHSSHRSTRPSVRVKKVSHYVSSSLRREDSTRPSGKSVVYTHRKTSFSHVKYVHKPNQKPL